MARRAGRIGGTGELKWILDGRFLQQEVTGPAESLDGPPFSGLGFTGYDNMREKHTCLWLDNMGTGWMVGEGTCDADGKTVTMTGESANPTTGQLNQRWRTVTWTENKDEFSMEMFMTGPDGKEMKSTEIAYTRAR